MTITAIRQVVQENLARAEAKPVGPASLLGIINRAKDEVVARMEQWDEDLFTARQAYTVAQGDASITLPADFRRLVSLTRTDTGSDVECELIDVRQRSEYEGDYWPVNELRVSGQSPVLYAESGKLYFIERAGAPSAMTLLLRYRKRVADAVETAVSLATEFDGLGEWDRAVANRATAMALPRAHPDYQRFMEDFASDVDLLGRSINRRIDDRPMRIRMVD